MTNLHTTTALTEFKQLSPEQEQSSVGSFFSKVFSFKSNASDGADSNTEVNAQSAVNNVIIFSDMF